MTVSLFHCLFVLFVMVVYLKACHTQVLLSRLCLLYELLSFFFALALYFLTGCRGNKCF